MKEELINISNEMRELGLAALSHANRIDDLNDKWEELSVLQIGHAAEILVKARIAEEHPLLIFETFPKTRENELSLTSLFSEGHTIEWSSLLNLLWASTDINLNKKEKTAFKEFGKLRNGIQHFGVIPKTDTNSFSYLKALKFTYEFMDPFINKCWDLYAIDFSEDCDQEKEPEDNNKFWNFIKDYIIQNEIEFNVSPYLAKNTRFWWDDMRAEVSDIYKKLIDKQIKQISQS